MRISIIGLPGSGKTHLAQAISKKLGVPHVHLDRFWFESGGLRLNASSSVEERERVRAEVREKTMAAIAGESWVSDGFYSRLQPDIAAKANILVFLDIPLWKRFLNHAQRMVHPSKRHKELTVWNELYFFIDMVRRQFAHAPKLRAFLRQQESKLTILHSHKEADAFLHNLQ